MEPERRLLEQIKIYYLKLNDMRSSKIEQKTVAAWSFFQEDIKQLFESSKCEAYWDGQWGKSFKKDSILEWFNPGHESDKPLQEMWIDREGFKYFLLHYSSQYVGPKDVFQLEIEKE